MGTEDPDFRTLALVQLAKALLVLEAAFPLEANEALESAPARWARRRRLDLAAVKVRVAAVKKPSGLTLYRDRRVPARVAGQWHDQDIGVNSRQRMHGLEAQPLVARDVMRAPLRPVRELVLHVAGPLSKARLENCIHLGPEYMKLGVGEVRETAGVIDVEVRRHEVANVARGEAERLDLADCRLVIGELRAHERGEGLAEELRVRHLRCAEPGVYEDESVFRFDQEHVSAYLELAERAAWAPEEARAVWAHRRAT